MRGPGRAPIRRRTARVAIVVTTLAAGTLIGGAHAQSPASPPLPTGAPATPGAPAPGAPGTPATNAAPVPPPGWLPRGDFELKALDKVDARSLTLTGRVGQPIRYATLTILVQACVVRPPDVRADAAAFIDITDSHPDSPRFHGWMFANEPAVAMFEHPIYDIRVIACHS